VTGVQTCALPILIPLYLRSNKEITEGTLNDYLSKLNIVHRLFTNTPLNTIQKTEIRKAIKGNKFDRSLIDTSYFNDSNTYSEELNNLKNSYNENDIMYEILRLKEIYYKLNTTSQENVWDILQALLQLTIEYNELKNKNK
jgi:hypothetical protein